MEQNRGEETAMRAIGSMSSGMKRVATALAVAAGVLTAGALVSAPAMADDGWRGHHRHHHHYRHHHGGRAYFNYGPPAYYYAPPRVYYAPPPVYYAPPPAYYAPPSSLSLGLSFPLR
jgi:hypothetical protein